MASTDKRPDEEFDGRRRAGRVLREGRITAAVDGSPGGAVLAVGALVVLAGLGGCVSFDVEFTSGTATGPGGPGRGAGAGTLDTSTGDGLSVTVVEVVDGDTLDVRYPNGTTDTVRLLGVDTPEVHVENDPAEFEGVPDTDRGASCLRAVGENASDAVRGRVAGETVRLVVDSTADRRDRYGRLLAYVVDDGRDLNRWLVAGGLARVYDATFRRSEGYYAAESDAQAAARGVWRCRSAGT
ncbi:MAG: thermonuclease family protein [Haloarculaceae archaeon]